MPFINGYDSFHDNEDESIETPSAHLNEFMDAMEDQPCQGCCEACRRKAADDAVNTAYSGLLMGIAMTLVVMVAVGIFYVCMASGAGRASGEDGSAGVRANQRRVERL